MMTPVHLPQPTTHLVFKQTLPSSSQESLLFHGNLSHEYLIKRDHRLPSLLLPTSLPEHMKISTMAIMSVLSVLRISKEAHEYGRVEHAGQFSTLAASRNGPPRKALPLLDNKSQMVKYRLLDNGDAQVAIYQKILCPLPLRVGVRKRSTRNRPPAYLRFRADRHVQGLACPPRNVRIHVPRHATLVLALHAPR